MNPLVSIIIPTYNRADTVCHAIDSVIAQTYKNTEIIVVDDGSTDSTSEVLRNYTNIIYLHKENSGQASARNTGLQHATGSYIATLDSDDIWYPRFLEECILKLTGENLDFVFANWDQEEADGKVQDFLSKDIYIRPYLCKIKSRWVDLNSADLKTLYTLGCPSPSSSVVIKRNIVGTGWNNDIKIGDDWYLYLSVLYSGERRAAFTLDRLWKKRINNINIYDGRKRSEVLEHLYIVDLRRILHDFKDKMEYPHFKKMRNKHVYSMVELAKHNLIREFNIPKAVKLLCRSFFMDARQTFKSIPEVIRFGMQRIRDKKSEKTSKVTPL